MSLYSKAFGWTQVDRTEMVTALMDGLSQGEAASELGMYDWQWDIRARQVKLASATVLQNELASRFHSRSGRVYDALNQLINMMIPKEPQKRFGQALAFAEVDDRISGIIETQVDFGLSGFRVASKDSEAEKKIDDWNKKHRIYNTLLEMWHVAAAADNVVVMMQKETKAITVLPLPNLKIIPIHTTNSEGRKQFRTFLKVPMEMQLYIKKALRQGGKDARIGALKGIPKKWIDAVQHPTLPPGTDPIYPAGGYVELMENDGEKIFVINRKGIEDRLVNPSMTTVFPSINLRRFLQDGEFSIAYLTKYFIHQIKVGAKGEGQNLGQILRAGSSSKEQRIEVKNRYRGKVDKVIFEVTDQFLEHVFHFPGHDVDFGPRYATPDARIDWWARISRQIVVGAQKGGSFSGGLIYLKGYARKIDRFRELFSTFLEDIYTEVLKDPDTEVQWDQQYMKEPRQKLDEMKLTTRHGMVMETVCRILGYSWKQWTSDVEKTMDPDTLKKKGAKDDYLYQQALQTPFFEPNQGLLTEDDEGGRPSTDDNQTDDSRSAPTPRPAAGGLGAIDGADVV